MNSDTLNEIIGSIQKIKYGEVVVIIHDCKVVQIETREKKRFQQKGGDIKKEK